MKNKTAKNTPNDTDETKLQNQQEEETSIVTEENLSNASDSNKSKHFQQIIKNKKAITVIILIFALIPASLALAMTINKKQQATNTAKTIYEKEIPNMEKYTKEYFEQAQKENRILTDEEKQAYIKLFIDRNSLLGKYASKKNFTCNISDPQHTMRLSIFSKGENLRMDISKVDNETIERSAILSTNDFWGWSTKESNANVHIKIKDEFERLQIIDYALASDAQSADVFTKSCKETDNIEDAKFVKPENITFIDQEDK